MIVLGEDALASSALQLRLAFECQPVTVLVIVAPPAFAVATIVRIAPKMSGARLVEAPGRLAGVIREIAAEILRLTDLEQIESVVSFLWVIRCQTLVAKVLRLIRFYVALVAQALILVFAVCSALEHVLTSILDPLVAPVQFFWLFSIIEAKGVRVIASPRY